MQMCSKQGGTGRPWGNGSATGPRDTASRLVVVALTVVLAFVADQWQQQREFAALVSAIEAGEAGIVAADDRVGATFDYYSPVLVSSDSTAGLRRSYQNAVAAAGLSGAAAGRGAPRRRSPQIRVLPWHGELHAARAAYEVRLSLWAAYLAGLATDPDQLFQSQDQLAASRDPAATAIVAAIPWSLGAADAEPALGLLSR